MTFYLRPPEGTVPVHLFQLYAESRLKFLIILTKNPDVGIDDLLKKHALEIPRLDALVPSSTGDRLAHFALRTVALLDPNLIYYVQKWEVELFQRRLFTCTSATTLDIVIRQLLRHLRHFIPFLDTVKTKSTVDDLIVKGQAKFLKTRFKILLEMAKRRVFRCHDKVTETSRATCPKHGSQVLMQVPFTQILPLVENRGVTLINGNAQILCHQIPKFLELTFKTLLEISTQLMRSTSTWSQLENDLRLREGCSALRQIFSSNGYHFSHEDIITFGSAVAIGEVLDYDTLIKNIQYFPPCMSTMYKSLRTQHRLCHQSRVQLTLFFKSIFVPLKVTLSILQEEYSKPPAHSSTSRSHTCGHSWSKDSKRYIYGTRHLYGLEGSRKNYSVDSCSKIQNSGSFSSCGGCPFVQSKETKQRILSSDLTSIISTANEFLTKRGKDFETEVSQIESCHEYLLFKMKLQQNFREKRDVKAATEEVIEDYGSHETCSSNQADKCLNETDSKKVKISMISKPTDFYNIIKKCYK